ncbi:MAG TPA: ABC transporter permease [Bacteroidia bacterium]|nr:ABC transporter permease [Bacteroidia bacterium]HQF27753.1 ABC transporter permease [Bacteroidia bacterium]HQK97952.1 ABC transporter permease [Bacteroidia bacterium]
MNLSKVLAGRILSHSNDSGKTGKPVIVIAIIGIALGVLAMLLSVMIVTGFRNEISGKVTGFMSHMRIHKFDSNNSFEDVPISKNAAFISSVKSIEGIKSIQPYAYKAGILKTKEEIQGIVLKGIDKDFDKSFFSEKMTAGKFPDLNDSTNQQVAISKTLSEKLNLKVGDSFLVFFIQQDKKVRKLIVSGIYNTGLNEDFDNIYILCNLDLIRKINNWEKDEIGGYEVNLSSLDLLDKVSKEVYQRVDYQTNVQTIRDIYPQIFNWLDLQNLNVIVIITLISLVAGITMISTLLILVLENSRQIGLLKALGAEDKLINITFRKVAASILLRGMMWGNILGLGLAFLQWKFHFIGLDESSYYISSVPVNFTLSGIAIINITTYVICMLMLLIPGKIISKINPIKVLRFD